MRMASRSLVSAFDGDISGMLDKLNGMLDASKEYKNFAGISTAWTEK